MSDGACNAAARRRLKETAGFMALERSVGVTELETQGVTAQILWILW